MPRRSILARAGLWAVGALVLCTTIVQASPRADSDVGAGPHFAGYVTEAGHTAASHVRPRFDFAALDADHAPAVQQIARAVAHLTPRAQLQAVNARINRVPTRDDRDTYGVDDHWATPQEFFRNGGDCEDYAIAKYAVLERLGWPPERLWIVVMRETVISPIHAVLMVELDGRLLTLDNLGDRVFVHGQVDYYRPAYSLNRFGAWWHGGPVALAAYRR
jgi:predicted transglutaminase-like cysteine proteinase